jgi:hypothetical protein
MEFYLPLLYVVSNLAKFILQRCNNPERGIKCVHVKFRKRGPKYLDDLHLLFEKVHVTGASASCPGDIPSSDSSDEEPVEITPVTFHVRIYRVCLTKIVDFKNFCEWPWFEGLLHLI